MKLMNSSKIKLNSAIILIFNLNLNAHLVSKFSKPSNKHP